MKTLTCRMPGAATLFLGALFLALNPAAQPESPGQLPKPTRYVNDFANVFSADSVAQLERACAELDHSTSNAQLVIVTVHSLDGMDAADFANQLEDRWQIGRKGSDRGIMLLLAVDDRKWRIDVGYGLEGILNDAKLGDIGRSMVPFLRASQYDSAANVAVTGLSQAIAADAQTNLTQAPSRQRVPMPFWALVIVVAGATILIVSCGLMFFVLVFKLGAVRSSSGYDSDSSGSSGSSGSSSGGGESGVSDGGSFGGGGAGGSW